MHGLFGVVHQLASERRPAHCPFFSLLLWRGLAYRRFSALAEKGGVMSQSEIRAKLCAGKISIGSSIQAQHPGDFMRRKWRSYGLFDTNSAHKEAGDQSNDKQN